MAKLRHISGDNLKELERQFENIKLPVVLTDVNHVSGVWYFHFLIQGIHESEEIKKVEINKTTAKKTRTRKKKIDKNQV